MKFEKTFRYYRKKLGITQEEMASKLGVTRQTYCHYENGSRVPSIYRAMQIAKICNITMDEFVQTTKKFNCEKM